MIFTKERYLEIIDERLSVLCSNIRKRNGDLFTDVNKGAENFYVDLLNLIYEWKLVNGNDMEPNMKAIDLIDKKNRIAVQVTSNTESGKVRDTLIGYAEKNYARDYDRLIILIITEKVPHPSAYKNLPSAGISFNPEDDIWDYRDLTRKMRNADFSIDRVRKVAEFLGEHISLTELPVESKKMAFDQSETDNADLLCADIWKASQIQYTASRRKGNRFDWDIIDKLLPNGLVGHADFECMGQVDGDHPRPILDIVKSYNENMAIIGEGGIGKTTVLRKLLTNMLRDERDFERPFDFTDSIPVFIELNRCPASIEHWEDRGLGKTNFITRHIAQILENHSSIDKVSEHNLELIEKLMQSIPKEGCKPRFLLLLDGFNEVRSDRDVDVRAYLSNEISVLDSYANVRIITTSRPTETAYYARKFKNIRATGLNDKEIGDFLAEMKKSETEISIIKENKALMKCLAVPLYLCMFSTVMNTTGILPETPGEILNNFFHQSINGYNLRKRLEETSTSGYDKSERDVILDFVLPYIGWRFETNSVFSVNIFELRTITDDAIRIVRSLFGDAEVNVFARFDYLGEKLRTALDKLSSNTDSIIGFVSDFCGILYHFMEITTDYKERNRYGFIHHQFRDYFSAVFEIRLLEMLGCIGTAEYGKYEAFVNRDLWASYKSELIAQILLERLNTPVFDKEKNLWYVRPVQNEYQSIFTHAIDFCRNLEAASEDYRVLLKNILEAIRIIRKDLSGLNLSDLDLREQHFFNVNCSKPVARPRLAADFRNSVFDEDSFEPEDHQNTVIERLYYKNDCFTLDEDGVIKCWDIRSGMLKYSLMSADPTGAHDLSSREFMTVSSDGNWLAVKGQLNMKGEHELDICLFELSSVSHERHMIRLPGHHLVLDSVAFALDSSCIYALCDHSLLYCMDLDGGTLWTKTVEGLLRNNTVFATSENSKVYINSYSLSYNDFPVNIDGDELEDEEEDMFEDTEYVYDNAEIGMFIEVRKSGEISEVFKYGSYIGMSASCNYFDNIQMVLYYDYNPEDESMAICCFDLISCTETRYFENILEENGTQPYSFVTRPGMTNEIYMIFPKNIYLMRVNNSKVLHIQQVFPLEGIVHSLTDGDPVLFNFVHNGISGDGRILLKDDWNTYEWDPQNDVIERKYNTVYHETSFMTVDEERTQIILVHAMNGISVFRGEPLTCVLQHCYTDVGFLAEKADYSETGNMLALVFVRDEYEIVKIVDVEMMWERNVFATSYPFETVGSIHFNDDGSSLLITTQYRCLEVSVVSGSIVEIRRSTNEERYAAAFYTESGIGLVVVRDKYNVDPNVRNRCEYYVRTGSDYSLTSYYILPDLGDFKNWFITGNNDTGFEGEENENGIQKYWVTEGFFLNDETTVGTMPRLEFYGREGDKFVRNDRFVKPLEMIWVSHSEALHKFQPGRPYLSYGYLGSNSAVFMRDSQDLFYATNIHSVKYSDLEKGFEKRIGSYDGNAIWGYAVPWQNNRIVGCGESNRLLVQNSETGEEDYEVDYYPGINVFGCDFRKSKLEELSEMKVRAGGGII